MFIQYTYRSIVSAVALYVILVRHIRFRVLEPLFLDSSHFVRGEEVLRFGLVKRSPEDLTLIIKLERPSEANNRLVLFDRNTILSSVSDTLLLQYELFEEIEQVRLRIRELLFYLRIRPFGTSGRLNSKVQPLVNNIANNIALIVI